MGKIAADTLRRWLPFIVVSAISLSGCGVLTSSVDNSVQNSAAGARPPFDEGHRELEPVDYAQIFGDPVSMRLIDSSPTVEGHGFVNALDGSPNNNYVAGLEGDATAFVVLALEQPIKKGRLQITWENRENFARQLRIRLGSAANDREMIFDLTAGPETNIGLFQGEPFRYLRVDFSDFQGNPRLLLRQLRLFGGDFEQGLLQDQLDASDTRNPLHFVQMPITKPVKIFSDTLTESADSQHQAVLQLIEHINTMSTGVNTGVTPEEIIREGTGECGSFSTLLLALAAAQGIQGHYINLYNWPSGNGHTVVELLVDGAWGLYDPTYGGYHFALGEEQGVPLSYREISERYHKNQDVGFFSTAPEVRNRSIADFVGKEIFLNASPQGPLIPEHQLEFPLSLDLTSHPRQVVGDPAPDGGIVQGIEFVGIAAGQNRVHRWTISGLKPGERYVLRLGISGVMGHGSESTPMRLDVSTDGHETSRSLPVGAPKQVISFPFTAQSPEEVVQIRHDYSGELDKYVSFGDFSIARSYH